MSNPIGLQRPQLESLYTKLETPMFNVVYRWVWDDGEAQDIVQDAFIRLWKMRHRVDTATVEPLVYRIAVNLASKRRRALRVRRAFAGREQAIAHSEPPDTPELSLNALQRQRRVRQAVDQLPERLRRVVMLCEFSGFSYQQVADALEIPIGTVASRRNKAVSLLKKRLGGSDDI